MHTPHTQRPHQPKPMNLALAVVASAALSALSTLSACSGGGGGDPPPPPPTLLSGTAAVGAALAGATITVSDADTATADPAAVTAGSDGRYSVNVSGLKAPLLVKASGTVDGSPTLQWAVVPALNAEASHVANVTPLTSAVAALVAPGGDPAVLATAATLASNGTVARVGNASSLLVNTLATDSQIATRLGSGFNPLSTPFTANGDGIDGVLDQMQVELSAGGVTLTNRAASVADGSTPASVTLTAAQTATPTTVPTLPPTAAIGSRPSTADLDALAAKLQACLALPLSGRVTLDGSGTATALAGACNYAPTDWKSNGRTWLQEVGQYTIAKPQLSGARVGRGTVVLALAPEGRSAASDFKHPYCNDKPCVVVRQPLTTASGRAASADWVLGQVAGQWNLVGNQRPFRAYVEPRLYRKVNSNRNGAGSGSTLDPYFLQDRFESTLRLIFDLNTPGTEEVRAVRVSGPGLPPAGVVLFRSQACGTDDRMGITFQNGSTRVLNSSALQYWTGATAADFYLDAARLDGTPLAMPLPVNTNTSATLQNYAPAAVANQATLIPAWASYKWEIFRYSTLSETPDLVFHGRIGAGAENASAGVSKPWPTLDAAFAASHLVPGAADAGTIASTARSMSWAAQAGTYVSSAWVYGSNFASASNGQNETAGYTLRTRLDFEPAALGDTTATGTLLAATTAGTSLSSFTQNAGTNPNPRCASNAVVPLTSNINDYREAGLFFRGSDRKAYSAIWFWEN